MSNVHASQVFTTMTLFRISETLAVSSRFSTRLATVVSYAKLIADALALDFTEVEHEYEVAQTTYSFEKFEAATNNTWACAGKIFNKANCFIADSGHNDSFKLSPLPFLWHAINCFHQVADADLESAWKSELELCRQISNANHLAACANLGKQAEAMVVEMLSYAKPITE